MKKIICTLALAFIALSCSKDEDSASVVATWDRNQVGTIAADGTVSNLENYDHFCSSEKDNFAFTNNGIFKEEELYSNSVVEVVKTTESTPCEVDENNGTYVLNGSTLTLTFTNDGTYDIVYEVISLSETELKLKRAASVKARDSYNYYTFTKRK